jgi:ribosomal protein L37E
MKDISGELDNRNCVICTKCGAIFENCHDVAGMYCPSCNTPASLRFITTNWIRTILPIGIHSN